jgi:hypothetical protein
MTSCNMFPHTREGVMSELERTREEMRGFREHWEALERAVAVNRRSGWRMRRLDLEVRVIVAVGDGAEVDDDSVGERGVNGPRMLMVSPNGTR